MAKIIIDIYQKPNGKIGYTVEPEFDLQDDGEPFLTDIYTEHAEFITNAAFKEFHRYMEKKATNYFKKMNKGNEK
ncbi:hypothetical protein ACPV36_05055 [Photobacterium damselae]|uniref:hypothetical protein n=1 Tax=Photobacterium damselae TaxID=38293 RepID=UPI00406990BE